MIRLNIKTYNKILFNTVIDTRDGIQLPESLGWLFIGTCQTSKKKNIDFNKSSKYGVIITNSNLGTDGKLNVQLQERFDELTVKPNEIFGGEQDAQNKFKTLVSFIDAEANRLQKEIDSGRLAPTTMDDARQRVSQARSLSGAYKDILTNLDQKEKGDIRRFFN